jgi:alkanesulfonate monooxygenase SsuD/methylene tetrahydromethanopterin reductase-like flavin-dependent oxidoreductase (luciferase family)
VVTGPVRRLGLFTHLDEPGPAGEVYRYNLDLLARAEQLGVDTAWVAVRHFRSGLAGLPAAFPFLAALAVRTSRIRLGTAVVPLAFEDPIRLAEDAAVLDALSGGRVELGVGKGLGMGFSAESFRAFQIDERERDRRYTGTLAALRRILGGAALTDGGSTLYPPAPELAERIWQATSDPATTIAAAQAGDALQLTRGVPGADSGAVQAQQARTYLAHYADPNRAHSNRAHPDRPPRIGISRAVVPAASRDDALHALGVSLRASAARAGRSDAPASLGEVAAVADRLNTKYGTAADIVDQLAADPAVGLATDLIIGFSPLVPEPAAAMRLLETVTTELAPALGWSPAEALV